MKKIKLKTSIILLLMSVLGIVTLVNFAQNSENKAENFDDNLNIARIFRLVNSLNKEAEKQQSKGFEKRAEMLKNYFQKKTGISNEANLKLKELAANFQKESEKLNAEIKESRKNQKNKPNDGALPSELMKLRESRNKLFDDSRQSLNNEVAKDDSEKVLKFLRENVLDRIEKNKNKKNKKTPNNNLQSVFQNVSYDEATDEAAMTAFMTAYSWIDYDQQTNEILSVSVTEGDCLVDLSGDHDDRENECSLIYVSASLSDPETGVAADSAGFSGSYADVYLFTSPTISGQYCVDAEHRLETDWDYFYDYSQTSDCVNVELPTIDILWNGNSIKETTQEAVVGQKIELSVSVTGGMPTNQQWMINGDRVKSYFAFTTLGKVTPLEELNQQNISFHWFKGGDGKEVKFTATINGQPYTATANFNVKQPSVTNLDISKGNIFVNYSAGNPALSYGDPTFSPGVRFEAQVDNNGISGSYHWVQTYVESKTLRLSSPLGNCNSGQTMTRNQQGLDETYPYPSPTSSGLIIEDSPQMSLISTNDRVTISDSASAWLMFRPNLADAIWIPMKKVDWSWAGEAIRINNNNEWQKVSSSNPNPIEDSNLFFPEWNTVINNALNFTCQP